MNTTDLTIENVEIVARAINNKDALPMRQSRELAEYYVKYLGFETALNQSK